MLRAGSLADLKVVDFAPEPLAPNEVRVAVRAIGLNFADVFAIWGLYGATPKGSFTPGLEYSGVVEEIGAEVTQLHPGDRVMGVTRFGAYTTHLNIDARYAIPMPASWSFETGAAYLVQTLTAYYGMTTLGGLQKGHHVLIHSAAGGVGLQALKIAQTYGCYVIGTVGSPAKVDFARSEGYDQVIVRGPDFPEQLRAALDGRPLNLLMDSVGGAYFSIPFSMLAPMGRAVVFGSARYAQNADRPNRLRLLWQYLNRPKIDPQRLIENNRAVMGFNLIWLYKQVDLMHQLLAELEDLQLKPPHVGHRFSFEQLPDAVQLFQTGKTVGKIVVDV